MKSSVTVHPAALHALACGLSLLTVAPAFAVAAESPLSQAIGRLNADTRQERGGELRDLGDGRPSDAARAPGGVRGLARPGVRPPHHPHPPGPPPGVVPAGPRRCALDR